MLEYDVILEIPNSSNLRYKVARLIPRIPAIRTQLNFKLRRNSMSSIFISTRGLPTVDLEQTKLYHNFFIGLTTNLLTAIC